MEDQRLFIRFGEWSEDEVSRVTWRGLHIKDEIGVSVYNAAYIDDKYLICFPCPHTDSTIDTLSTMLEYGVNDGVFVVTGDVVGVGMDGEPLLKNVKLVKDISDQFAYAHYKVFEPAAEKRNEELKRLYDAALERGEKYL